MFGGKIGLPELLVIVFIALLIFGPKKLGDLGKGLGEGLRNFKSSINDHSSSTNSTSTTTPTSTLASSSTRTPTSSVIPPPENK